MGAVGKQKLSDQKSLMLISIRLCYVNNVRTYTHILLVLSFRPMEAHQPRREKEVRQRVSSWLPVHPG